MAIPGPGVAISMDTIAAEFGGTIPHSLSEYYRGGALVPNSPTNAAVPTSGQIAIGNFYGATNRIQLALTLSSNTYNYDVYTEASSNPAYVAGITDVTVTVNPASIIGSTSTSTYAMLVPSSFDVADTVTIVNNGVIQGMGGGGGAGGSGFVPGQGARPGNPGLVGGNAIYVNRPTDITNNGVIAGGGGGGGGGAGYYRAPAPKVPAIISPGGGGGGGAGYNGGATAPKAGGVGTSSAGGAGGPGSPSAGPGGAGGGRGANGVNGTAVSTRPGGTGGLSGYYVVGNPFVNWQVNGTRQGLVS